MQTEITKPIIVVDRREKKPLKFPRLESVTGLLPTGDYSICGAEHLFCIERKTTNDLTACSTGRERQRFERALQRLRAYPFRRLLVIGLDAHITKTAWHFVLEAEIKFDVPVVWLPNPDQAATQVERWAMWFARQLVRDYQCLVDASRPTAGEIRKPSCENPPLVSSYARADASSLCAANHAPQPSTR